MHFQKFQIKFTTPKVLEIDFYTHHRIQHAQKHGKPLNMLSISNADVFFANINTTLDPKECSSHREILHARYLQMRYVYIFFLKEIDTGKSLKIFIFRK